MKAKSNLFLTNDRKRVVEENDPEANPTFPFASAGEEIPEEAAEQFGLKQSKPAPNKKAEKPADKKMESAMNKEEE